MAKIGIVSLMPHFLKNIVPGLKKAGHEIKEYVHAPENKFKDGWNIKEVCDWADLLFCEFCQHPMDLVTYLVDKPIIARLWRCEIYNTGYINRINWEKVDHLFIATENMHGKFQALRKNKLKPKKVTVFEGPSIDLDKFSFVKRERSHLIKMAIVGNVIPRKRVFNAVQMLVDLPENVTLTIAGRLQDIEYAEQIKDFAVSAKVSDRIHMLNYLDPKAMPEFMQRQDIILGMSTEETAHYAIAEGMATGCLPFMSYWKGCEKVYPKGSYFYSMKDMNAKINSWVKNSNDIEFWNKRSKEQRDWSEKHFDKKKEVDSIVTAIEGLL